MTKQIINGSELAGKKLEVLEDGLLREVKQKYIPEYEDCYYFIDSHGRINGYAYSGNDYDKWIIKHNHVFHTKEECKQYKRYIEMLDEYTFEPDWKDIDQERWYIIYNHSEERLDVDYSYGTQYHNYYFETLNKINEFIEKVGELNIKRFMFDIWD